MVFSIRNIFQFTLLSGLILYIFSPCTPDYRSGQKTESAYAMIKNYAIQHKLEIIRTDEDMQAVLLVGGDGSEDSLLSVIEYFPEDSIISIFSCFPAYVEKKYFSSISLYLMGINNYVVTGHFELDTSLRQIHFRTSLPFRYFNPKDSILLKELLYTIRAMNEEVPGIYKELGIIVADSTNCGEEVLV